MSNLSEEEVLSIKWSAASFNNGKPPNASRLIWLPLFCRQCGHRKCPYGSSLLVLTVSPISLLLCIQYSWP